MNPDRARRVDSAGWQGAKAVARATAQGAQRGQTVEDACPATGVIREMGSRAHPRYPASPCPAHSPHFVSYIDRTREYYAAQGYEKPYVWARHTERTVRAAHEAARAVAASRSSRPRARGGRKRRSTACCAAASRSGRVHARRPRSACITDDLAWDKEATHTRDVESFLPIRRLHELAAAGRIGSARAALPRRADRLLASAARSNRMRPRSSRAAARTASTSRCWSRFDPSATRP